MNLGEPRYNPWLYNPKGEEQMAKEKRGSKLMSLKYKTSSALKELTGKSEISRPEAMKLIWDYIKKNKLQDTKNRRMINPDANFAKVFGSKQLSMFDLAKKIGGHISAL